MCCLVSIPVRRRRKHEGYWMNEMNNVVTMAHGSGGRAIQQLIERLFLQAFDNPWLNQREDGARLLLSDLTSQGDRLAFTTDSYVIDPIFFPGGDIGKLAVCGTANDLAVSGATPRSEEHTSELQSH